MSLETKKIHPSNLRFAWVLSIVVVADLQPRKWASMISLVVHWHVELLGRNIDEGTKDPIAVVEQKRSQRRQTKLSRKYSFFLTILKKLEK
jgi:hypothetical protein